MSNSHGKCIVCGAGPTVKAHFFPRALALDMRGSSPTLVAGNRHRDGIRLRQNGEWDDRFLCDEHEKLIGLGDDYGVRFCRKYFPNGKLWEGERAFDVINPKPTHLLHFAYAVIWRHVASEYGRSAQLDLGPYYDRILSALTGDGPFDLDLIVGADPLTVGGEQARLAIGPYREKLSGFNVWHFAISNLDFYLKTDARPYPATWRPFLANANNPVVVGRNDARDISTVPKLFPILRRMHKSKWKLT